MCLCCVPIKPAATAHKTPQVVQYVPYPSKYSRFPSSYENAVSLALSPCTRYNNIFSLDCCLLLSICVLFRCVLHPLPLPLSSCLGCIPPLIGLPSLRFYAVGSSLFLLSVCFCLCFLFYRDDVLCWLLLVRLFLSAFHAHVRFPV